MIVGLVRPGFYSHSWNDFEYNYAHFLAQQLANDTTKALIELDYRVQRATAEVLQSQHCRDKAETRTELLSRSQIWKLYAADILVFDMKLRREDDLQSLDQWVDDVCCLNELASNSNPAPFRLLNNSKQAYLVVTSEPKNREQFEKSIQGMLSRIGITSTTFFFRAFDTKSHSRTLASQIVQPDLVLEPPF